MNTKLVDSLVRAIKSLSIEERTLLETRLFFDDGEFPTSELIQTAQVGNSFDFLSEEPDLYSLADGEPI